jgi:hypothetical protein
MRDYATITGCLRVADRGAIAAQSESVRSAQAGKLILQPRYDEINADRGDDERH